ncbi:MAG TPA: M48 family metalloprotease [Geodermatophilus sp.]|nr:M48 family metalloprotease [Geodermatophilus sp.]
MAMLMPPAGPRLAGMPGGLHPLLGETPRRAPRAPRTGRRPDFPAARRGWTGVKTALLLGALGGLLVLIGSLFGRIGAVVGLVLGLATVGGSYWYADRLALWSARAVPVGPAEMPAYHRIVRELCAEAGLPMPRLYVTPDPQPNAFATGRNARHAAIAITRGLYDLMTPDELRAVLAHELAHVGNRDVLLTSVAAALATGIGFLAEMAGWLPFLGSADEDDQPGPVTGLVAALIAPLAAMLLQLALSRSREFEADRTGAALVGDGRALASALAKIELAVQQAPMPVRPAQASAYVVNPLTGLSGHGLAALFMTHPPTAARTTCSPWTGRAAR